MTTDFLRNAREAKRLSLEQISDETRISLRLLKKLEHGEFGDVPPGIYARAHLRTLAGCLGLDPEATVRMFEPQLPVVDEPLSEIVRTALAERGGQHLPPRELPRRQATTRRRDPRILMLRSRAGSSPVLVPEPEPEPDPRSTTASPERHWRLYAAAIVDGMVLASLALMTLFAASRTAGVTMSEMLRGATLAMAMLFATATVSYFGMLGGIAGRTLGARLFGIELVESAKGPLDLSRMCRRSLRCLAREMSILIGVVLPADDAPASTLPEPEETEAAEPASPIVRRLGAS
jgi:transcriptional regulator with XRE-family HTH domain